MLCVGTWRHGRTLTGGPRSSETFQFTQRGSEEENHLKHDLNRYGHPPAWGIWKVGYDITILLNRLKRKDKNVNSHTGQLS